MRPAGSPTDDSLHAFPPVDGTVVPVTGPSSPDHGWISELVFAERLATLGGQMLRERAGADQVDIKDDGSEVTAVDLAVHHMIADAVESMFPDHALLSEEGDPPPDDGRPTWVVDPLDGTFPYTAGIGISTVSIALVADGVPVVAAVCDPYAKRLWSAAEDYPTTLNGQPCRVSERVTLDGARINLESMNDTPALFAALDERARVVAMWAAVRTGAAVADGSFDAVLYGPGNPWDVAATTLLISQAGGRAGVLSEPGARFDRPVGAWIGATPAIFDELADLWADLHAHP